MGHRSFPSGSNESPRSRGPRWVSPTPQDIAAIKAQIMSSKRLILPQQLAEQWDMPLHSCINLLARFQPN